MSVTISGTTGVSLCDANSVPTAAIQDLAVTPSKTQAGSLPSMVRLDTANGRGSTNTMIPRFTNIVTYQGTDITYADSATLGASFTINTDGVYAINYNANATVNFDFGISLNSAQLSTGIASITNSNRLCLSTGLANYNGAITSITVFLPASSVVRPHLGAAITTFSASMHNFTITRVA